MGLDAEDVAKLVAALQVREILHHLAPVLRAIESAGAVVAVDDLGLAYAGVPREDLGGVAAALGELSAKTGQSVQRATALQTGSRMRARRRAVEGAPALAANQGLPFTIAHALAHGRNHSASATSRFWNMHLVHEQLLRLVTLVLLADLARKPERDAMTKLRLAKALRRLRTPCRGDWSGAMGVVAAAHLQLHCDSSLAPLAKAAATFSKVKADAVPGDEGQEAVGQSLDDALLWLRNGLDSHAGTKLDDEFEPRLALAEVWIGQLLGHFEEPLRCFRVAGVVDGRALWFHGADARCFAPAAIDVVHSEGAVWGVPQGGESAPFQLAPLVEFIATLDPVGCHDGFSAKKRRMFGVKTRTERTDIDELMKFLGKFDIDLRLGREDISSWGMVAWAQESTLAVVERLRGVKYHPDVYVERPTRGTDGGEWGVEDQILSFLRSGATPALLVEADAGGGKTSVFCWLAERLLGHAPSTDSDPVFATPKPCVLLVLGESMQHEREAAETPIFRTIAHALHLRVEGDAGVGDFASLLDAFRASLDHDDVAEGRSFVLLVDAMNEAQDPTTVVRELRAMAEAARRAWQRAGGQRWVRIVASVRRGTLQRLGRESVDRGPFADAHDFETYSDAEGRSQPFLSLRPFTPGEVQCAYESLASRGLTDSGQIRAGCGAPWSTLGDAWVELLRHPLNVAIFHEAFAGQGNVPVGEAYEHALWRTWVERVVRLGHAPSVFDTALAFARAALEASEDIIPADAVDAERELFRRTIGDNPARLAAFRSPVETLEELGVLRRRATDEELTFRNDAVAECLAESVLLRQAAFELSDAKALTADGLQAWWRLPPSRWRTGAVAGLASEMTRRGCPEILGWLTRPQVGLASDRVDLVRATLQVLTTSPEELSGWLEEGLVRECNSGTALEIAATAVNDVGDMFEDRRGGIRLTRVLRYADVQLREAQWERVQRYDNLNPEESQECRRALSFSYDQLGGLLDSRDAAARGYFEKSLAIRERLAEEEPERLEYQRDLSISYDRLGGLLESTDAAAARGYFERSLAIAERLAEEEPERLVYQRDLSIAFDRLGGLFEASEEAARGYYERSLAIAEHLAEAEPESAVYQRDLGISYNQLGGLLESSNAVAARGYHEKCLAIRERLAQEEPESVEYQCDLRASYSEIGRLLQKTDAVAARGYHEKSLAIRERLAQEEPGSVEYQRDLRDSYGELGRLLETTDAVAARGYYEKSLVITERLAQEEPESAEYQRNLSIAYPRLGRLLQPSPCVSVSCRPTRVHNARA
ncbi:MAG: tetratricopeptide repeat protein [Polyangiaceae bacterium]|nr:tetratricopeptide repeat protein [Polyangiaceae bacterium]